MRSIMLISGVALLVIACGHHADKLTADGWELYENGRFSEALEKFKDAIDADHFWVDAFNGKGWCYCELDSIAGSVSAFINGFLLDSTLIEMYAGLTFAYGLEPNDNKCIDNADQIIGCDPQFIFNHNSSITIEDVRLVKARACCNLGDFAIALEEIKIIDPSFNADPATPEGQRQILSKLEALSLIYG